MTTRDIVEAMGVAKAADLIAKADLVLFLVDGYDGIDAQDHAIYHQLKDQPHLIVRNKKDLCTQMQLATIPNEWTTGPITDISATKAIGLERLSSAIVTAVVHSQPPRHDESSLVPNLRQKRDLEQAVAAIGVAKAEIDTEGPIELAAEYLKVALKHLGQVSGKQADDAVLDEIFGRFCIGK